jgi:5-methylcytosine-specific restriction endonuclease McrA
MFVLRIMTTREEVDRLLAEGYGRGDIARRLGIARSTVSYHARRLGAAMDGRAARRYDWREIQAYYAAGHSVRECRERFGFGSSTWSEAVQRSDVVPRSNAMPIPALVAAPRGRAHLKSRLLKAGLLKSSCQRCGITNWQGELLSLELHHINGIGQDNRLENLTLLCPNCHSQTDSWGGRNRARTPGTHRQV